jgi:hypothetical protein
MVLRQVRNGQSQKRPLLVHPLHTILALGDRHPRHVREVHSRDEDLAALARLYSVRGVGAQFVDNRGTIVGRGTT